MIDVVRREKKQHLHLTYYILECAAGPRHLTPGFLAGAAVWPSEQTAVILGSFLWECGAGSSCKEGFELSECTFALSKEALSPPPFLCATSRRKPQGPVARRPCEGSVSAVEIRLRGLALSATLRELVRFVQSSSTPCLTMVLCRVGLSKLHLLACEKGTDSLWGFSSLVAMAIITGAKCVLKANRSVLAL